MRIGIICGKTSEEYLDKNLVKKIPKKYKINNSIHTDIALAYIMIERFTQRLDTFPTHDKLRTTAFVFGKIMIPLDRREVRAHTIVPPARFLYDFILWIDITHLDLIKVIISGCLTLLIFL